MGTRGARQGGTGAINGSDVNAGQPGGQGSNA
jgi:hypothetical protein